MGKDRAKYNKRLYADIPKALRPTGRRALVKQARNTIKKGYKSAFAELATEEKMAQNIDAKRVDDNRYYLDWLNSKTTVATAAAAASSGALASQHDQIAQQASADYETMRTKLVESGAGGSTNQTQQAAFDVAPQAQQAFQRVAAERQKFASGQQNALASGEAQKSAGFASIAKREAMRQSDLWKSMSEIAGGRRKLAGARAGDTATEIARLRDREITKAQAAMAVQGDRAKSRIEAASLGEKVRHDKVGEQIDKAGNAIDAASLAHDVKYDWNKLKETIRNNDMVNAAKAGLSKQQKSYANRAYTQAILGGDTYLRNNAATLPTTAARSALSRELQKKQGLHPLIAQAAAEIYKFGNIVNSTQKKLKAAGYKVPGNWR